MKQTKLILSILLAGAVACSAPVDPATETDLRANTRPGVGASDSAGDQPLTPSNQEIHVQGIIREVTRGSSTTTVLLEASRGGRYRVTVTETTAIRVREAHGGGRLGSSEDLAVGLPADIWLIPPVKESDPAQATASRIAIYETAIS